MDTKRRITSWIISIFLIASAAPALAADAPPADDGISSTAVARLKIGKGTAWVRSGGSTDWEEAATNYPLAEKSRVNVPQDSQAEIQYHGSQSLLLKGGSEVDIRRLGDKEVSYRLRSGEADLSLPKDDFAPVRVKVSGNREVRIDSPGRYSLAATGGTTRFIVRAGEGSVTDEEGSPIRVRAGEEASIGQGIRVGRADKAAAESPPPETTLTGPEADAEVPPAVASELRPYGEWVSTQEYGYVWRPYVDDGWEPYYYGRWVWADPYGWTWVGYEPWGWWPYHTGWWWPSPVFGWVWCPFHSFASVNFFFGNSFFFGHNARFFPANVRFVGRDGFVRWVPLRPGETRPGTRSFARGDSRLARWNQPVERGSVRVRTDGGHTAAWAGNGSGPRMSGTGRGGPGITGGNRGFSRPSGAARPRSGSFDRGSQQSRFGQNPRASGGAVYRGSTGMGNPRPVGSVRTYPRGVTRGNEGNFRGADGGGFRGSNGGDTRGFGGGGFRGGNGGGGFRR